MASSRLTAAMEEAYAAAPSDVAILHTLELSHPSITPIRVVTGDDGPVDGDPTDNTIVLTLETGASATFTCMAFDVTPPGFDDDGPTSGKIRIDGISNLLVPYMETVASNAGSIKVVYRAYRSDLRTEPGDVISGLRIKSVDISPTAAEATIGFDEVGVQAFPRSIYDVDNYPAIFGQ